MANITVQVNNISVAGVGRATKATADYLRGVALTSFANESAPDGKQWAALNPAYAKRKKGRKKILQATGQYRASVFVSASVDTVILQTNRPVKNGYEVGILTQFGTGKMPARPIFPIDRQANLYPKNREEILALIRDSLEFG